MNAFPCKIRISPDVIWQDVLLGETLLMNVSSLVYFGLDEFGSTVWREMLSATEAGEIYQQLLSSTELPSEALAAKFESILKSLEASGIITLEPSPADLE